jgi:hypothetical protein
MLFFYTPVMGIFHDISRSNHVKQQQDHIESWLSSKLDVKEEGVLRAYASMATFNRKVMIHH